MLCRPAINASSVKKIDRDAVAILHWVNTGEDAQGEVITTTNHELQKDAYESYLLTEPEEVQEIVNGKHDRIPPNNKPTRR